MNCPRNPSRAVFVLVSRSFPRRNVAAKFVGALQSATIKASEPLELVEKLAALVPAPRVNLIRYHGVLAPAARDRARVVPGGVTRQAPREAEENVESQDETRVEAKPRPRNYSWAELMRRVFEIDALECPGCNGRMRILASIHSPDAIRAILECLGLPARAPPRAPADPEVADPEIDAEDWQEF